MIYFKTSHVKVYPSAEKSQPTPTPFISKHLMLKFILATDSGLAVATPDFKTSHVKVYLNGNVARPPCFIISKHLMLKFILWRLLRWRLPFQISKHLMLKFISAFANMATDSEHFKTSHVKVYPNAFPVFHTVHYTRFPSIYQRFKNFYQPSRPLPKKLIKSLQCHCFCGFTQFYTDWRLVNFHCITKSTAHHFPYPSFQAPPRQTHFH